MTVIFSTGYAPGSGDQPTTHARIAHSGNWLVGGTIVASTTDSAYYADAPDNSLTYELWKPTALPATWDIDMGSGWDVDYCCIAAHNLGTAGASVEIRTWNGAAWISQTPATLITDDTPIMAIFPSVNASKFRVRITGTTIPTIGAIRFGAALQMPRPVYGGVAPPDYSRNVVLKANLSETGEFLGRSKQRKSLNVKFQWNHVSASWVRSNWWKFQDAVEDEPFFIAWRPGTFGEVAYAQALTPPTASNMGIRDLMTLELEARGYA